MNSGESTQSLWKADTTLTRGPLEQSDDCDVCIVGAGIAGLSCAYELARIGKRVIVLDAHQPGRGETGQTTAHLASALDDRFSTLERVHGQRGARLAYESHAGAIDSIERIIARESIACNFQRLDGYLFLSPEHDTQLLDEELDAATRAGFEGVARLSRAPLSAFDTGPCLRFPQQARFHPLRYVNGLAEAIERLGGVIHGGTMVTDAGGGQRPTVHTSGHLEVRAGAVILATNSPFHPTLALHSKQAPYRTFAIALRCPRGALHDALYWDTGDPYHYVRLEPGDDTFDRLIVGGEDHRTGTEDDAEARYRRLEDWARTRFAMAGEVTHRWSGQVLEPFDHLAYIGRDPAGQRNLYVATGDSGHGMTHGAIAGLLLSDLVLGRDNIWRELYDPSRKSLRAAGEYVRDNLEVASEYARWLKPERKRRLLDLAPGDGTIIQRGLHKIAVCRDQDGNVHERSAVCTHLGGIVSWNSDAKSWDCPCHGSRFAPTGEVLNGPAARPLAEPEPPTASWKVRMRSAAAGILGGGVATLAMTAVLWAAREGHLLGEPPPRKIVRRLRRRAGIRASRPTQDLVTTAAHLGFGMATGALFGVFHPRRSGGARSTALGVAYGALVWAANYGVSLPALDLMPAPRHDRPGRPTSMIFAHLVYGGVLGAVVRALRSRDGADAPADSRVAGGRKEAFEKQREVDEMFAG